MDNSIKQLLKIFNHEEHEGHEGKEENNYKGFIRGFRGLHGFQDKATTKDLPHPSSPRLRRDRDDADLHRLKICFWLKGKRKMEPRSKRSRKKRYQKIGWGFGG